VIIEIYQYVNRLLFYVFMFLITLKWCRPKWCEFWIKK